MTVAAPTAAETTLPELDLDDLAARTAPELEELYRAGRVPKSLAALDGAPRGRMLAVRGLGRGLVARALRRIAASQGFVWDGKSFTSRDERSGSGINRVNVPYVLGRQQLFPFHTRFGESAIDRGPTVVLDYDLPENPPLIRAIHDEVREVSPGLFLGPAMIKTRSKGPVLALWFALDTGARR
jgi:hypothetical protein